MPILMFLFVWGVVELLLLILVSSAIGALATIGLLLLAIFVGMGVLAGEKEKWRAAVRGRGAMVNLASVSLKNGAFRLIAGMLLLLPGFLSDILAIFLLVPPLRKLLGAQLLRLFRVEAVMGKGGKYGMTDYEENVVEVRDSEGRVVNATLEVRENRD